MESKIASVAKAAAFGAVFGGVVGMAAVPCSKKKKRRRALAKNASKALRAVGMAMENAADILIGR